jgi:cation diffusion facilitator CzcD-associated flavoprotein CzcO
MAKTESNTQPPRARYYNDIVCIGGGLSAIALGAHAKITYSFADIHYYDRNASMGGTWWINTYPGKHPSPHYPTNASVPTKAAQQERPATFPAHCIPSPSHQTRTGHA